MLILNTPHNPTGAALNLGTAAAEGGHIWRIPTGGGRPERLTAVASYYHRPAWSPDGAILAVFQGDLLNTWSNIGRLQLLPSVGGTPRTVVERVSRENPVTFTRDGQRLLFQIDGELVSARLNGGDHRVLARVSDGATQVLPSPDGRYVAYVIREDLYLAPLPGTTDPVVLGASTGVGLTRHGGVDPHWESGGQRLTWTYANQCYRIDPDPVLATATRAPGMPAETGGETAGMLPHVMPDQVIPIPLTVPRHLAHGTLALRGARVITMNGDEVLEHGTMVITNDRITAVGPVSSVEIPTGVKVLDVRGKTILPGLVGSACARPRRSR